MKVKYVGDAPAMSYILGEVQPGEVYEIDNKHGLELIAGLFVEVKQVKKVVKKEE
jgi:hypothetical protein